MKAQIWSLVTFFSVLVIVSAFALFMLGFSIDGDNIEQHIYLSEQKQEVERSLLMMMEFPYGDPLYALIARDDPGLKKNFQEAMKLVFGEVGYEAKIGDLAITQFGETPDFAGTYRIPVFYKGLYQTMEVTFK